MLLCFEMRFSSKKGTHAMASTLSPPAYIQRKHLWDKRHKVYYVSSNNSKHEICPIIFDILFRQIIEEKDQGYIHISVAIGQPAMYCMGS